MPETTKPHLQEHAGFWEVIPNPDSTIRVCVGISNRVEVDKLFGPLAAHPVRVWLDYDPAEWVIECQEGTDDEGLEGQLWVEKVRFSCQTGMED